MEQVLITGGAGFIGRFVTDELLRRGYRVRVLDALIPQVHGEGAGRPEALNSEAEFIHGDVRDKDAVARALKGVDSVVHLAAEVGVGQSMYEVERYTSTNDVGTAVLFEKLIDNPVRRVVTASSMSIYGEGLYRDADGALVRNEDVVEQCVVARRCPHTQGVPGLDGGDAFFSARDEGVHDLWVFGVGVVAGVHAEPIPRR